MRWNNRNIGAYHKQIIQTFKIHNAQIDGFNKPKKVYEPIHHSRIIGIDQASHMASTELQTSLMITSTPELAVAHNTTGEPVPFAIQLEYLSTLTDSNGKPFLEHDTPSRTKQREPRKRTFKEQDEPSQSEPNNNNKRTSKDKYRYKVRDGRRKKVEPILLVSHNLETFLGRAFRLYPQFRRVIQAGATAAFIKLPHGWELEIAQLVPGGNGCSAEFYARKDGKIMRLKLFSLTGYLENNPEQNAREFLDGMEIEPIPGEWLKRQHDSFTPEEQEAIRQHVTGRATTARLIYNNLVDMLLDISPYAMRRSGILPNSVAGAAAKIAFSMAGPDHWDAPSHRVQQIGALNFIGVYTFFNREFMGYNDHLWHSDISSAHGYTMSQVPDPATCEYIDITAGPFNVDEWKGKFGAMRISGTVTDNMYTPLRKHNPAAGKLKYVKGDFDQEWLTIPEIVMAVVSNRLKVSYIHDGVLIEGSNEGSFLREFAQRMYEIKESAQLGSLKYNLAKKLMVSLAGKLAELNKKTPHISPVARKQTVPIHMTKQDRQELLQAHLESNDALVEKADELISKLEDTDATTLWGNIIDRTVYAGATTGVYYLPLHAAQIWGMAAGMLSLAANCTNAISGYTDSLTTHGDPSEGLARYRELMRKAGYEAPESGMGSFKTKIRNGYGYLARPGTWVIRWNGYTDTDTGEIVPDGQQKALHGLDNLGDNDAWDVLKEVCENRDFSYETEEVPYTLLQSYLENVEPGTLTSYDRKVSLQPQSAEYQQALVEYSEARLRRANNAVAYESTQDIPTTRYALGCVKILARYGMSLRDISDRGNIPFSSIKDISSGRRAGLKHIESLRELVTEVEQEKLHPARQVIEQAWPDDISRLLDKQLQEIIWNDNSPKEQQRAASDELLARCNGPP